MKKKKCDIHSYANVGNQWLIILSHACNHNLEKFTSIYKMGIIKSKQTFSTEDLLFFKSYTGQDKEVIKKWCKAFQKDYADGHITPVGFVSICEMFFPYINANTFCDYIFKTFDTGQNGFIVLKELMQVIGNPSVDGRMMSGLTSDDKLKWAMIVHDMWVVMARLTKMSKC